MTVDEALRHKYLEDGRMRFHSCMCTCCKFLPNRQDRIYVNDMDPLV